MTRDADSEGVLSDIVDVWSAPPSRRNLTGDLGCVWLGPGPTGIEDRIAQDTLEQARNRTASGTVPETSRESVRIEL